MARVAELRTAGHRLNPSDAASVTALWDAIEERVRTDADAVLPVLALLAEPDGESAESGAVRRTARALNHSRLEAAEQRFRAGALTTQDVRERLRISRQAVAERVRTRGLLAAKVGSRLAYPDWQFARSGLVPGLAAVLLALRELSPGAPVDVRAADAVMRAPQPGMPDRMSLAELLALGEVDEVTHRLTMRAEQA